jgi:LptD protein
MDKITKYRFAKSALPFLFFCVGLATRVEAQKPSFLGRNSSDSTSKQVSDTARFDSIRLAAANITYSKDSLDAEVDYGAKDSLIFDNSNQLVYLYGAAFVNYRSLALTADYIIIDMKNNIATAEPRKDTSGKVKGVPHFKDGSQDFTAQKMRYNFRTKKGMVYDVTTTQSNVYIHGGKSKFVGAGSDTTLAKGDTTKQDDIAYSADAIFTSCNAKHPHFGIQSAKQKIIPNKLIVVGPSNLVIGGVPTPLWLPFGFYPITKSKSSGLIIPRDYEYRPDWGYGFNQLGYYIPINEHRDLTIYTKLYVKGAYGVTLNSSYNRIYKNSGDFSLIFNDNVVEDERAQTSRQRSYGLRWAHRQDSRAHPTMNYNASVSIETNNNQRNSRRDYASQTQNQLNSSANFSKTFPGKPYNFTASFNHSQNTATREMNITLPNLNFTMQTISPFKRTKAVGNERWYEKITLNYNSEAQNSVKATDTTIFQKHVWQDARMGVKHNASSAVSFRVLKYFNFTPSINYSESWFFKAQNMNFNPNITDTIQRRIVNPNNPLDYTIQIDTLHAGRVDTTINRGFYRAYSFNTSISLTTILFGTLNFGKKSWLRTLRHTVTPQIGFGYSPDYSQYSNSVQRDYRIGRNQPVMYNRYDGAAYTAPSGEKQMGLNYGISNLFEAKYFSKRDSVEKKTKLFEAINISGTYNFAADSLRWSSPSFSTNTNLFKGLTTISIRGGLDFYDLNAKGLKTNTLLITNKKFPVRVIAFNIDANTSFSIGQVRDLLTGKLTSNAVQTASVEKSQQENGLKNKQKVLEEESLIDLIQNWRINHYYGLALGTANGRDSFRTTDNRLSTQGDIKISKNWRITVSNIGYDFVQKQLTFPQFGFYRDLHCWEMGAQWQPTTNTYQFFLRVKPGTFDFINIPYNKNGSEVFK